jgi:hypothetical protein
MYSIKFAFSFLSFLILFAVLACWAVTSLNGRPGRSHAC